MINKKYKKNRSSRIKTSGARWRQGSVLFKGKAINITRLWMLMVKMFRWADDYSYILIKEGKRIFLKLNSRFKKYKKTNYLSLSPAQRRLLKMYRKEAWRQQTLALILIVVLVVSNFRSHTTLAATYTFNQVNWGGGQSANLATHPGDQSNWNKYESKDANLEIVNGGTALQMTTAVASTTQTDNTASTTGFNLAGSNFASSTVSGTGNSASVELTNTTTYTNARNDYTVNSSLGLSAYDSHTNSIWVLNSGGVSKINPATGVVIGTYNFPGSGVAFDSHTNSIWVVNSSNNTVKKINSEDGSLIGSYTAGSAPADVEFDPSTNSIWVANGGSANVTKINSETGGIIGTSTVATGPRRLAFDSSTNSVWVTNYNSGSVSKILASDGSVTGTYSLGFTPRGVAFDSYTNSIWVVNWNDTVAKVKASDGSITATYSTGGNSGGEAIAFDPVTNSVWIGLQRITSVIKVNVETGAIRDYIGVPTTNQTAVTFEPLTNSVWISGSGTAITKITVLSGYISGPYSTGTNSNGIAADTLTNSLWVTNYGSNNVTKMNPFTGATIGTYPVGTNPLGVTFDPSTNSIWVVNAGSNNVSKINPTTGAIISTSTVAASPQRAVFDSSTNSIWVVSSGVVTQLRASDGASLGTATVGSGTSYIAFDSYTNSVWVSSVGALYKIDTATRSVTLTLAFGSYGGIAFDSLTNSIWTAEYNSGKAKKVNVTDGTYVQIGISIFYDIGVEFDPLTNTVWFTDWYYGGTIVRVNPAGGGLATYYGSVNKKGIAFDPVSNSMWFANSSGVSKLNLASTVYDAAGTYTSGPINLGSKAQSFSTLTYTTTLKSNSNITIDIRAGDSANTSDGSWTAWQTGVASGGDISTLGSHQFIQYRVNLSTSDGVFSSTLDDITINYSLYPGSQSLISSPYDTTDATNVMGSIGFTEDATLPSGTGVTFSIRTASSQGGLAGAAWYDFTDASTNCSEAEGVVYCPLSALPSELKSGGDDRFWQYKITLASAGDLTPTVSGVEIKYVVNASPEIQNITASQGSDGKVNISYDVRDPDASAGSNTPWEITPSFEYWDGSSWTSCTTLSAGATDNKDVEMEDYTTYTLTWDPKVDHNNHYLTDAKIRVKANDNEGANNISTSESNAFTLDTVNPVVDSFVLDARSDAENDITISVSDDSLDNMQMKLSNRSDLAADGVNADSGQWIAYSATKVWTFTNESPTVYYQIKDKYGNISNNGTHAVVLPTKPPNILYQDVSNTETEEWREFIAWGRVPEPPLGFKQYNIYRSTDGENFSLLPPPQTDRSTNFVLDANLDTNTVYYYRVTAEDDAGNISFYSDIISDRPDGQGGTDLTPPVISNVVISEVTAQSALITWETDEPSNSTVSYITNDSGDFTDAPNVGVSSMMDTASRLGKHSVFLNNLEAGVEYYIQVSSADPNTNTATGGLGMSFTVLAGPVISNVQSINIRNDGATVTWDTSSQGDSRVYYSLNPDFSSPASFSLGDNSTAHSVNLTGLSNGTTYYYYVKSGVAEDKNIIDGEVVYYTFTTTSDIVPPTISFNQESDITDKTETSARISWLTSELATSTIEYSTDESYSSSQTNSNLNTDHSFELTSLSKGTLYNFRLKSTDVNGNPTTSPQYSFSTPDYTDRTAPTISFNIESDLTAKTENSIRIHWTTSEYATSSVEYSEDDSYNLTASNGNSNIDHNFELTSLTKGTLYNFRLKSTDANGNATTSDSYSFTTLDNTDVTPPIITFDPEAGLSEKSETSIRISWTTNEAATSSLEYGSDLEYGSSVSNDNLNTSHSFKLTGLTKGTLYNFRLKSTDAGNNLTTSDNYTFTTEDHTDVTAPVITSVQAEQVADTSALITWTTDEGADSLVDYGTAVATYTASSTNALYNYSHSVVLSNLSVKTKYYFQVTSKDSNGNATSSSEFSFTTQDTLVAGATSTTVYVGGGATVIDKNDRVPPIISALKISDLTANRAKISWSTDETADSMVEFGVSDSYGFTSASRDGVTSHSLSLPNLFPNTSYYYRVTSADMSGNISEAKTGTFTTPTFSASELELDENKSGDQVANDSNFAEILRRTFDFIKQAAQNVSLSILESSLIEQQNSIKELAGLAPAPEVVSGPTVKTWEDMAIISWETNKKTSSLVNYSEVGVSLNDVSRAQVIGNPDVYSTDHQVILVGLKSATTYNYQLKGATVIGSSLNVSPSTFTTLSKAAKVDNYVADRLNDESASFKWSSSLPTDTSVRVTPYRNNTLSYDEARIVSDGKLTSIHEMTIDSLEPGVFYKIDLFGRDNSGKIISQTIEAFSTVNKELPFLIEQVKTSSALAAGNSLQVQTIISWDTTKLSTSKVYYRQGTSKDDNYWPSESPVDAGYTRHHLVIMTDFLPGEIYQFQVESTDSNGQKTRSKTYTVLTPRQKESVFQVILKNIEQTFGWMGGSGGE